MAIERRGQRVRAQLRRVLFERHDGSELGPEGARAAARQRRVLVLASHEKLGSGAQTALAVALACF